MTTSKPTGFLLGQILKANVQRLLDDNGMSADDLAREAEFGLGFVQDILSGRSGELALSELEAIATALGVEASDLLRRDPQDA